MVKNLLPLKKYFTKKFAKTVVNHSWAVQRETLLHMYRTRILSKIGYGRVAYSSTKLNVPNTINSTHNQGIRNPTWAFRSSPVTSLFAEHGEPPLDARRKQHCFS